ncbi:MULTISPECIES: class I SAM-dependent methyltransferase [Bifidobacterium]|jgi:SAM-dependent methyltransferase|uniref:Methyltransferase domain-containing protein n=2 Tax=Bifidobacterium TaxID=1678 RepID=A0AB39U6V3_9BIFI|nr:class I SAM-dependent methyltransferase [Bifidobacterium crudilactis]MDN5973511.1 methyltransferase domain-containing protein [Bifidobacterium crudilactis]MDN6001773.1 methyltransferase domain-containing protein [Bifidobacterium crudilactis]MDN6210189.1 methyltransferase domain-containing protein [Bifidobacterium crudilactis]MDN6468195.1 methyltransferase domain-containing protein [Bifidobacterium crudilactis]MDN6559600.1 methyltransferase domain-containing protein [Bifidobacterium crudilac
MGTNSLPTSERHAEDFSGDELPFSERDSAHLPGHWLLARLGKRVLRPGGLELTQHMLDHAKAEGGDVVEFAPGLGRTATEILGHSPASYIGVDEDPKAAAIVGQIVAGRGHCITANASDTGLPEASADVVVGEAMLTMQSDRGRQKIIAEAARLLRPGGRYAIHELGLQPDTLDTKVKNAIRKELAQSIKVSARPLTAAEWTALLKDAGFEVDWVDAAPMALLNMKRNIADEGIIGVLRIVKNLLKDSQARSRVLTMKRTFTKYKKHINGIAIVAHKLG